MKYTAPSFTVPTGHRPADRCSHGWLDVRGRCVFCGAESGFAEILPAPTVHYPATLPKAVSLGASPDDLEREFVADYLAQLFSGADHLGIIKPRK